MLKRYVFHGILSKLTLNIAQTLCFPWDSKQIIPQTALADRGSYGTRGSTRTRTRDQATKDKLKDSDQGQGVVQGTMGQGGAKEAFRQAMPGVIQHLIPKFTISQTNLPVVSKYPPAVWGQSLG